MLHGTLSKLKIPYKTFGLSMRGIGVSKIFFSFLPSPTRNVDNAQIYNVIICAYAVRLPTRFLRIF